MNHMECRKNSQRRGYSAASLFDDEHFPAPGAEELIEVLARGKDARVERIVSTGQTTPEGEWYDQEQDEWVALLTGKAELTWENGEKTPLAPGDWLLIPAHARHRVTFTSEDPPCVWIAFHSAR